MCFSVRVSSLVALAIVTACVNDIFVPRPRNVVLITLDTTRADRLPAYGFASVLTPALDRLAREGVVFNRAMSVAPLTLTAHTSLLTGLYPPHHGVRDNADAALDAKYATVATILQAAGFHTGAFVGSTVLSADRGLARGFDVYDDGRSRGAKPPRRRSGDHVVDGALAWLDSIGSSPFLLWVHLYDAHAPQTLPTEYRRTYGDSYVGGIAFEDAQVGRLIDALDRKHLLDSTAIVIAADHGESLGDHGEDEHGIFLYESTLHVPLIVRARGLAPTRVTGLVSLVDVLPTVLDLVGLPIQQVDGISLLQMLKNRTKPSMRNVYAESMYAQRFGWSPLRAVIDEQFKYIDAPKPELYDRDADPFEEHNLIPDHPAIAIAMRNDLEVLAATQLIFAGSTNQRPLSADASAGLASLGYVSGVVHPAKEALDPKDYIHTYNAMRQRLPR
jgi:arylsulfatase A-like enzyme